MTDIDLQRKWTNEHVFFFLKITPGSRLTLYMSVRAECWPKIRGLKVEIRVRNDQRHDVREPDSGENPGDDRCRAEHPGRRCVFRFDGPRAEHHGHGWKISASKTQEKRTNPVSQIPVDQHRPKAFHSGRSEIAQNEERDEEESQQNGR